DRSRQSSDARDALAAAAAGNLPERHLRQGEQGFLGREPDIAGHGQLEADAHRIFLHRADHWLGTALGRGDVPGEVGHAVTFHLWNRLHVAARRVHAIPAADHHHPDFRILAETFHDGGDLAAPAIGDDVERRSIEPEPADLLAGVDVILQAVEIV